MSTTDIQLRWFGQRWRLLRWNEHRPSQYPLFPDRCATSRWLQSLRAEPENLAAMRRCVLWEDPSCASAMSDDDAIAYLAALLCRQVYSLQLVEDRRGAAAQPGPVAAVASQDSQPRASEPPPRQAKPATFRVPQTNLRPRVPTVSAPAAAIAESGPVSAKASAVQTPATWIEIELLGEDDAPIASEQYRIVLPDGSQRSGMLDALGCARIDDIRQPGTCLVCFPRLDRRAWHTLATSQTQDGLPQDSLERRAG